jgi:hypothetical protein
MERLNLAGSFIAKAIANNLPHHSIIPGTRAITSRFNKNVPTDPISLYPDGDESPRLLCNRMANCSWDRIYTFSLKVSGFFTFSLFFVVIVLVQAAYAGVHLGALSIMFPSQKERLLWKISCYILFAVTSLSAIALFPTYISSIIDLGDSFSKFAGHFFAGILMFVIPVILCARAYIVVESFISLRHVPVEVYQTPRAISWIMYLIYDYFTS